MKGWDSMGNVVSLATTVKCSELQLFLPSSRELPLLSRDLSCTWFVGSGTTLSPVMLKNTWVNNGISMVVTMWRKKTSVVRHDSTIVQVCHTAK